MLASLIIALAAAQAGVVPATDAPPPVKTCREAKAALGSHIRSGRTCKTAEQWAEEDAKRADMPASALIKPINNERFGPPDTRPH